ncbi:MAG: phospholipase C, phosphocholine-specific [Verrucomicrobia bacterium]|nr:phospholipase C, phosphocholine-specific [Verrucomicrobiota bacterium]
MNSRRSFLKKAGLLAAGLSGGLPESIQRAFAINPKTGTTWMDAEHVVILMQENRSFDHCYGTLQGVRGFNDPRAVRLPNGNPVWLQSNAREQTYSPFHLDIRKTKATWMGSLPHSWPNQVDARNQGRHDGWLDAKRSGHRESADIPMTMGYYTREDIPFYYALADAFTVCDQHFCSSLTGTMPNRLYLWTGSIRGTRDASAPAKVLNENVEYESSASWTTFPERLEANGISWKVYQNELSLDVGLKAEEARWLANFGDNPLEWFSQYHVKFSPAYGAHLDRLLRSLPEEIARLQERLQRVPAVYPRHAALRQRLEKARRALHSASADRARWTPESFAALPEKERRLHERAFSTNSADPFQRELAELRYKDGGVERRLKFPKGDVLHQFRNDVASGQLPAVSWIVAPENFSDHPGAAWFGAWYVSEVMDILTSNPAVWRKTVLILTYDENDGYFDHVPPFVAPHPGRPDTGSVSEGMSVEEDFVTMEEELRGGKKPEDARESSIGLGFRVPLVIASPWSRGGYVCSQVFDHTSVLQFLERLFSEKMGRPIGETNISDWRRAICGDLTSSFRPYDGGKIPAPRPVAKLPFLESIHRAQFREAPHGFRPLTEEQAASARKDGQHALFLPRQEPGVRPSCALPYEIYADGHLSRETRVFWIVLKAESRSFGERAAGAPFDVCAPGRHRVRGSRDGQAEQWVESNHWSFALRPGSGLSTMWPLQDFENGQYHLTLRGPNGFFREFRGTSACNRVEVRCGYEQREGAMTGNIELQLLNHSVDQHLELAIEDLAYGGDRQESRIPPGESRKVILNLANSSGWYDFVVRGRPEIGFEHRYAGRVETGRAGITDPAMAKA